ncbi:hypothetical protein BLNAU_891 [Blattamonas nauphoetae]|uniref:Uncharacterized protein n=1 Tax=Blattamonas nauphoetae TaxID=2049346 RepID=A0ABQ9YKS9_9EUKA|nr:hypothetical protein BLNAU_891 [Blattamonas nauphoetae]
MESIISTLEISLNKVQDGAWVNETQDLLNLILVRNNETGQARFCVMDGAHKSYLNENIVAKDCLQPLGTCFLSFHTKNATYGFNFAEPSHPEELMRIYKEITATLPNTYAEAMELSRQQSKSNVQQIATAAVSPTPSGHGPPKPSEEEELPDGLRVLRHELAMMKKCLKEEILAEMTKMKAEIIETVIRHIDEQKR